MMNDCWLRSAHHDFASDFGRRQLCVPLMRRRINFAPWYGRCSACRIAILHFSIHHDFRF